MPGTSTVIPSPDTEFLTWMNHNTVWGSVYADIADIAGPSQSTTPDGQSTAVDIILFLNRFFAGC